MDRVTPSVLGSKVGRTEELLLAASWECRLIWCILRERNALEELLLARYLSVALRLLFLHLRLVGQIRLIHVVRTRSASPIEMCVRRLEWVLATSIQVLAIHCALVQVSILERGGVVSLTCDLLC